MQVLRDIDGVYKVFVSNITKLPVDIPQDTNTPPANVSIRAFPNERRVRERYPEFELIDRMPPAQNKTVEPLTASDIARFETNPEIKQILSQVNFGNQPPQEIKLRETCQPDINCEQELLKLCKKYLKTKSKKQQELLYLHIEGWIAGVTYLQPGIGPKLLETFHEMVN